MPRGRKKKVEEEVIEEEVVEDDDEEITDDEEPIDIPDFPDEEEQKKETTKKAKTPTTTEQELEILKEELRLKEAEYKKKRFLENAQEKVEELEREVRTNRKYLIELKKIVDALSEEIKLLIQTKK